MGSFARGLRCTFCAAEYPLEGLWSGCPACQRADFVYPVEVVYDEAAQADAARQPGIGWQPPAAGSGVRRYDRRAA